MRIAVWVCGIILVLGVVAWLTVPAFRAYVDPVALVVSLLPLILWSLVAVLHVVMARSVWQDASRRSDLLFGIPPWGWALMVLTWGVFGLGVYWLAHESRFGRPPEGPRLLE